MATPAQPEAAALSATALFEFFASVPHPAASKSCHPMSVIAAPHTKTDDRLLAQIQSFCFPEYEEPSQQQRAQQRGLKSTEELKSMYMNRFDLYAMQPKSFSSFTFTLQLQDGSRLYGHVRRTLPLHSKSPRRYEVGRRGERALVILTHAAGAGQLYHAILKTVDSISSMSVAEDPPQKENTAEKFLIALYKEQQRIAAHYQKLGPEHKGKPLIAALAGMEVQGSQVHSPHDINRFMLPTCLLNSSAVSQGSNLPTADTTSSILPLLRCVGVAHALRIFAALLSERRVVLTSSSPTRLSTCSHSALAMLNTGLLHWQHLYIPVLPPHLWQYLAAPYPYLIGILESAVPKLDYTDGLGEVLLVNLDSNSMETRNIPVQSVAQRLPDLFSSSEENVTRQDKDLPPSASEFLAQDLLEILKTDKKTLIGETSALSNVGETAGKAAKAIKSGFGKLKARWKGQVATNAVQEDEEKEKENNEANIDTKSIAGDYIFTEGCHNEVGEQETRLAFTCFFLALVGNMRWYLNSPGPGQLPSLDRQRFLEQKRLGGDGQGSPLWPLLQNFCQTQMFEEFSKNRVAEVRSRVAAPTDSPLFAQCAQYHRQHNIDFGVSSVRTVARQVCQANPGRLTGLLQTNARRMAMSLTSNKNFEGDYGRAIAQLVEQCRESSSVLFDVMSVIWLRMRDCKGMQWKHGYHALQILKNLLYHGPLAAVAEATDGLDKIRQLRSYEHMRGGVAGDMRKSADAVYNLLVDRAKLWAVRRLFADKRREMTIPPAKRMKLLKMDRTVRPTTAIEHIHAAFHPLARPTIAPVPVANQQRTPAPLVSQQPQQTTAATAHNDIFGLGTTSGPATTAQQPSSSVDADLMGLFGGMGMEQAPAQPTQTAQPNQQFAAQPTIATIPAKPTPSQNVAQPTTRTPSVATPSAQPQPKQSFSQTPAAVTQPPTEQLPAGWVALIDPTSGRTYYANQVTKTTQWVKPQAPAAPPAQSLPAPTAKPNYPQPSPFQSAQPQQPSQRQQNGYDPFAGL